VPLLAINGSVGIGTGYSTDIPPHNPAEIVTLLQDRLKGTAETLEGIELDPWWIGFRGKVEKKGEKQWLTHGLYEWMDSQNAVRITELPVGVWTKDYKAFLDKMIQGEGADVKAEEKAQKKGAKKGAGADDASSTSSEKHRSKIKTVLKGFEDLYNDVDVNFVLYLEPEYYKKAKAAPEEFEKLFKLTSSWKTSNMCAFDPEMTITKYGCVGDILEQFFKHRLLAYEARRQHQIAALKDAIEELHAKWLFVSAIVDGRLKIVNQEDEVVLKGLVGLELPPRSDRTAPHTLGAYEYLLRMRVDRIKKRSVQEAEEDLAAARAKLAELEAMTAAGIWTRELEEFLGAWEKTKTHIMAVLSASQEVKVGSGKATSSKKKILVKK
jgi:DNA topoisomerase-2